MALRCRPLAWPRTRCQGVLCGRAACALVLSSHTVPLLGASDTSAARAVGHPRWATVHHAAPARGWPWPRPPCTADGPRATLLGCELCQAFRCVCMDATSSSCRSERVLSPCGLGVGLTDCALSGSCARRRARGLCAVDVRPTPFRQARLADMMMMVRLWPRMHVRTHGQPCARACMRRSANRVCMRKMGVLPGSCDRVGRVRDACAHDKLDPPAATHARRP